MTFIHQDPALFAEREKTKKLEELLFRAIGRLLRTDIRVEDELNEWYERKQNELEQARLVAVESARMEREKALGALKAANDRLSALCASVEVMSPNTLAREFSAEKVSS